MWSQRLIIEREDQLSTLHRMHPGRRMQQPPATSCTINFLCSLLQANISEQNHKHCSISFTGSRHNIQTASMTLLCIQQEALKNHATGIRKVQQVDILTCPESGGSMKVTGLLANCPPAHVEKIVHQRVHQEFCLLFRRMLANFSTIYKRSGSQRGHDATMPGSGAVQGV